MSGPSLHDLLDKLDDLGFPTAVVDAMDDIIEDAHALDTADAQLARIFLQLIGDLEAYAHGRASVAPDAAITRDGLHHYIFTHLQEEECPHTTILSRGPSCLNDRDARILALDFLLSEVQAAKMIALAQYKQRQAATAAAAASATPMDTTGNQKKRGGDDTSESENKRLKGDTSAPMDTAESEGEDESAALSRELHLLAHTLQVVLSQSSLAQSASSSGGRVSGVTALQLVRAHLSGWLAESPAHAACTTSSPIFSPSEFSAKQLAVLADVHRTFSSDYSLRISVMRKRLEVTLQSFMWGGKGRTRADELTRLAASKLATFPTRSLVGEYDLWCATSSATHIARLTSREYALRSSVKRVIIGPVPDRGGRVDTNTRIEAEYGMPAFTKRVDDAHGGHAHRGRGGGGGGGHRGGRGGRGRGR